MEQEPSFTAVAVARHKLRHQTLDEARILKDDFVGPLLAALPIQDGDGGGGRQARRRARKKNSASETKVRHFLAARSALAEVTVREAVERDGVRQVVLLGAGLDTMFLRLGLDASVCCIEADLMRTQAWKRARLEELHFDTSHVHYVPLDLRESSFAECLARGSPFDPAKESCFVWLGVVPYLSRQVTLDALAQMRGTVVFDFGEPLDACSPSSRRRFERRAMSVRAAGEPWLTQWNLEELTEELKRIGFDRVQMCGPQELADYFLNGAVEWMQKRGPHPCTVCVAHKK